MATRGSIVAASTVTVLACAPLAGLEEKPCRPGCVDERTRLVCDADGTPSSVPCPAPSEPCAEALCSAGACGVRPAVGAACGADGLARCNEGYACLGPNLQLTAGWYHTCAIDDGGKVWCWGVNDGGLLGVGSDNKNRGSPGLVRGLPEPAVAISAGYAQTCAVVESGDAYCWGENLYGDVDPDSTDPYVTRPRRVRVPNGVHFSAVRTGGVHTCALATDGTVFCWGANHAGQCGVDPSVAVQVGPTRVANLDRVTFIDSAENHTCALRDAAPSLVCWGDNSHHDGIDNVSTVAHKLGPNAGELPYSAAPVPVDLGVGVIAVGTAFDSTFAVGADGLVYAFGYNADGRLGTGSRELTSGTPSPVLTSGGAPLTGIGEVVHTGVLSQCVSTEDGRYFCWGTDKYGELGMGTIGFFQPYAAPASALPPSTKSMVHGDTHACVVVGPSEGSTKNSAQIWCYGNGPAVGNGNADRDLIQPEPKPVVWDPHNWELANEGL